MEIHRRQFVVGPEPVLVDRGWAAREVASGTFISHCNGLPVATVRDGNGIPWHLLGLAVQTDPQRPDPTAEIVAAGTGEVARLYPAWAGRWVLIGNGKVHLDASGLLGVFYLPARPAAGGPRDTWLSSSASLLAELTKSEVVPGGIERIKEGGVNWYPPPRSRYAGIRRLLPSQVLVLPGGELRSRPLLPEPGQAEGTGGYEDVLSGLQEGLTAGLRRAAEGHRRLWVPLSAGYDSRLVLALALHAGLNVKTYTMRKANEWRLVGNSRPRTSYVLKADMTLPPLIARQAGVEHRWIPKGPFCGSDLELFDGHTGGHTVENDRAYFSHGQWGWLEPGDLILRGGVFEVGHCFYWKRFPGKYAPGALPAPDEVIDAFELPGDSLHARAIREWLAWAAEAPVADIDWRDRMYIEQRVAGWLSSLEQALDLVAGERFYPLNAGRFFRLLTSIPEQKRLAKTHHVDLIARTAPDLLRFPFNPPEPAARRLVFRALVHWDRVRSLPLSSVVPYLAGGLRRHRQASTNAGAKKNSSGA